MGTVSIGKVEEFLRLYHADDNHNKGLKERAKYLPYFAFLHLFRVASFALILVAFGYYAILVYAILIMIVVIVDGCLVGWPSGMKGWILRLLVVFLSVYTETPTQINAKSRTLYQWFWFTINWWFMIILNLLLIIGHGPIYRFLILILLHRADKVPYYVTSRYHWILRNTESVSVYLSDEEKLCTSLD
eukprot:TRINITY_DN6680_c0_g1_i1.p1 TRINITY_DN6680_c0_g1~~TRINITY_DN6680_c0_g1_i1.p1  ORF type:complete len:196 (+),score=21.73 TRINITY_DN6680_c0_g1_i1:26-589(+)